MEKLNAIWHQQIIKIDEIYDKINKFKELIEYLTTAPVKNNNTEETAIKRINRSKAELECKLELIMQEEFETCKIFSDLYYEKLYVQSELRSKETKLEKLGVSETAIDEVKKPTNLYNSSWWGYKGNTVLS